MTRNNAIVPKRKQRKRNQLRTSVGTQPGAIGVAVSRPFTSAFTATTPGRASLRTTFEAFATARHFELQNEETTGFIGWFTALNQLLSPFAYFRVVDLRFTTQINGGAASVYTIAANVSNNPIGYDSAATTVLDDDYAGVCNATCPLMLQPPREYWQQGGPKWVLVYNGTTSSETSMGTLSVVGFGSSEPTTVIGWHTVDIEVEFHTLR